MSSPAPRALGMAAMFWRELTRATPMPRGPPPSAVMTTSARINALRSGGAVDGRAAAGYLYHTAGIARTIRGAATCLDLGCGTAEQLLQVATLLPETRFTGMDHDPDMLECARARAQALGLANCEFHLEDITACPASGTARFEAVISTMTLHDLADTSALADCLGAAARRLVPGGALYMEDFGRLKTRASVEFFVEMNGPGRPDAFSELFAISMGSAFTRGELEEAARVLPRARLHATLGAPFLCVIRTPDRGLEATQRRALQALRGMLPPGQQRDHRDLERFFAGGGMPRHIDA